MTQTQKLYIVISSYPVGYTCWPYSCGKRLYKRMNTRGQRPFGSSWRLTTTKRFHKSRSLEPKVFLSNVHVILIFNTLSEGNWRAINTQNLKVVGVGPIWGPSIFSLLHCWIKSMFPEIINHHNNLLQQIMPQLKKYISIYLSIYI